MRDVYWGLTSTLLVAIVLNLGTTKSRLTYCLGDSLRLFRRDLIVELLVVTVISCPSCSLKFSLVLLIPLT